MTRMFLSGVLTVIAACIVGIRAPGPGEHGGHGTVMCLECNGVTDPHKCHHVERCGPDHTCATDVILVNNVPKYYLSCRHGDDCRTVHNAGKRDSHHHYSTLCSECCHDSDGCNKNNCLQYINGHYATTTLPPFHQVSLMCRSCQDVDDPRLCTSFARCHPGEVCATDVVLVNGYSKYFMSCSAPNECHMTSTSPFQSGLFGKRASHQHMCRECCSHDACNNNQCLRYLHYGHQTTHASHVTTLPTTTTTTARPTQHPHMWCHDCHGIDDPHRCKTYSMCKSGETCGTTVATDGLSFAFNMGCFKENVCQSPDVLRKRLLFDPLFPSHWTACAQCCHDSNGCNKNLCGPYIVHRTTHASATITTSTAAPTTTTAPTTSTDSTTTTTQAAPTTKPISTTVATTTHGSTITVTATTEPPTTVTTTLPGPDPSCRDHEEDGFTCARLDLFNICTDHSSFAYAIAHLKCERYCGLCKPDPAYNPSVTEAPGKRPSSGLCTDYEDDGIRCIDLDQLSVCTDPASIAYVVAHDKCKKHCGFCTNSGSETATTVTTSPAVTTGSPCVDLVSDGFDCATYDSVDFCTDTSSDVYLIAQQLCPKHCGFCTPDTNSGQISQEPVTTVQTASTTAPLPTTDSGQISQEPVTTVQTASTTAPLPTTDSSQISQEPVTTVQTTSTTAPLPTTDVPCEDYEQDGFKCADYDSLNFCTDPTSIGYMIANQSCRKHCGICTPDNTTTSVSSSTTQTISLTTGATTTAAIAIPTHPQHSTTTTSTTTVAIPTKKMTTTEDQKPKTGN